MTRLYKMLGFALFAGMANASFAGIDVHEPIKLTVPGNVNGVSVKDLHIWTPIKITVFDPKPVNTDQFKPS